MREGFTATWGKKKLNIMIICMAPDFTFIARGLII